MNSGNFSLTILLFFLSLFTSVSFGQSNDTISDWDGITREWYVSTGISEVVSNPAPDAVNPSAGCFRVVTGTGMYDYMISDLDEAVSFELHPHCRLKVLAPQSGGDVTLKFENYNNTSSYEVVRTPVPGQWTELDFDFSGVALTDLTRIVIFYDFEGTASGISWYIDDIIRIAAQPVELVSNLPIVVISTSGVPIPDEPKIDGTMGIIDNGPGELNHTGDPFNDYNGNIGIETRGQSTQMFPKKSYAFETRDNSGENLDVSLLGFPAENDWILYAPYTDKSLMRNVVTFNMGHKTGNYCTRTRYCEVVINNDYKGIYVLEEKIKKDENRVDIATLKPDEIIGNDLSGGYIIKVDKIDPDFSFGSDGWLSAPNPKYPNAMDIVFQYYYPDPDDIVSQQRNYIRDYVSEAEAALISTGFASPFQGYHKYFDVPSFVDFMLLSEISKEVDKYRYSTYFYKEKDSDGGKLFAGPAWDFNLGYGNVDYWSPGVDYTGWIYTDVQSHEWSIMYWWKRLMEDPYFRDLAKTRYLSLRQNVLTDGAIVSVIDSIISLTTDARIRNFERWPILGEYVWPNYNWYGNDYQDEVSYFKNFLFSRLHWMDNHFNGNELSPWVGISPEATKIRVHLYGDYFRRPILRKEDFVLNDAPGLSVVSAYLLNASECLLTISADITNMPEISVTINEHAINTWNNLTSNKLQSASVTGRQADMVSGVFVKGNVLHIRSARPQELPRKADICSITGQLISEVSLETQAENILQLNVSPGLYFLVFNTKNGRQTIRFQVQ